MGAKAQGYSACDQKPSTCDWKQTQVAGRHYSRSSKVQEYLRSNPKGGNMVYLCHACKQTDSLSDFTNKR